MKSRSEHTRRQLLRTALAAPIVSAAARHSDALAAAPASVVPPAPTTASHLHSPLYARLGVKTFINAYGTLTTLSGSLIPPEVAQAMEEAPRQEQTSIYHDWITLNGGWRLSFNFGWGPFRQESRIMQNTRTHSTA